MAFWIILIILMVVAIWLVGIFNGLVVLKNHVAESFSDIDVQLKRRHDLIPNLISTVQGYATHERELFEKVAAARNQAISAGGDIQQKAAAENNLTSALKTLFAVAESYPELKANQNFLALQGELSETENKVMSARRFYNANVNSFNIKQEVFPSNIVANMFGFKKAELFNLDDISEREAPKADFSNPQQ